MIILWLPPTVSSRSTVGLPWQPACVRALRWQDWTILHDWSWFHQSYDKAPQWTRKPQDQLLVDSQLLNWSASTNYALFDASHWLCWFIWYFMGTCQAGTQALNSSWLTSFDLFYWRWENTVSPYPSAGHPHSFSESSFSPMVLADVRQDGSAKNRILLGIDNSTLT